MKKTKEMTKRIIGVREFGDTIDVTDPCYDDDVWCRLNDVKIVPGTYRCVIWEDNDEDWGLRVGAIGIYLGGVIPSQKSMECIGSIGVDAGLAGFFENKPNYSDEEWYRFCNNIGNDDAKICEEGFFSSSGCGDGYYDVFAYKNNLGKITSIEIRFF